MKVLVVLISIVLVSCKAEPIELRQTNNSEIKIGLLFEYDGCRGYRFLDGSQSVYYVNCGAAVHAVWNTTESCGKNCVQDVPHQVTTFTASRSSTK